MLSASTAQARSLDAQDAVRLSLERDRMVEAAEAGVVKARAEARQALLALFPSASVSAGYTRLDQAPYVEFDMSAFSGDTGTSTCEDIDTSELPAGWTPELAQSMCEMITAWMTPSASSEPMVIEMGLQDNYFVKATLEQVLFAGGALLQSNAARRDFLAASEEQLRLARQQAAYNAEEAFYGVLLARSAAQVTQEALATMEAYVEDLGHVVEVGMASRADLLAAQAQGSQARLDAMRASHGARLAELAFKVSLGLPQGEPLELAQPEGPASWDLPVERERLLATARGKRPDLAALDASLAAMDHLAGASWASWLPAVVLMGNLNWKNPNYSLEPEWYNSADITVAASWNLWDRGQALTNRRAAKASWTQLHAQRQLLSEMMDVELQGALSSFDEAAAELEVAQLGLEQAAEALRLEQGRFQQGMANNTQLLAAQAAASGARLALLQAETGMYICRAALRKAVGLEPEVRP